MPLSGLTLLIPEKPDAERNSLASAWENHNGEVLRLARFWDPPPLDPNRVRVYGSTSFVFVLKEKLGFELCTPADDLILSLSPELLKRHIEKQSLAEAANLQYPLFVKPLAPKLFAARVYKSPAELHSETNGLAPNTAILTSNPVLFKAEARSFLLDGKLLDCALYEGKGNIQEATAAAVHFAHHPALPRTLVLDVGLIEGRGWVVIELNPTWGAGLNGCRADLVWPAIAAASGIGTHPIRSIAALS